MPSSSMPVAATVDEADRAGRVEAVAKAVQVEAARIVKTTHAAATAEPVGKVATGERAVVAVTDRS